MYAMAVYARTLVFDEALYYSQVAGPGCRPGCRTFWFRCKVQAQMSDNTGKTCVRSPLPDSRSSVEESCALLCSSLSSVRQSPSFLPAHDMRSAERSKSRVVGAECRVVGGSIRRGTGSRDWCFRVSEEPRTPNFLECLFFSLLLTATNIYGVVCYTAMWLLDPLPLVPARQALRHGEL